MSSDESDWSTTMTNTPQGNPTVLLGLFALVLLLTVFCAGVVWLFAAA